jgi:DNA-binding FadR family transcriptional regulator
LREVIFSGALPQGGRLPTEIQLASDFGVSRATVREALRLLAAHGLLRTAKGQTGGSYVTLPTIDDMSKSLSSNIALLADARDLTLREFTEVRRLLEVPAARLAARRRHDDDLEQLRATIPAGRPALDTQTEFLHNRDFHATLIECCDYRLLQLAVQPVFSALQTSLLRSSLPHAFHRSIRMHHAKILEAIEAGDEDGAAGQMENHLEFLVPYYEKAWKAARLPVASGV